MTFMFVGMVFNEDYDSAIRIGDTETILDDEGNVTYDEDGKVITSDVKGNFKKSSVTSIYNTFIFLQIFNFINCRKVGSKDFNVFENFFHNVYFILVFFGAFVF
jgi:hypothetical protein